jgi:hypothetical protein
LNRPADVNDNPCHEKVDYSLSRNCSYPERGRANHLGSSKGKSHPRAMAVLYLPQIVSVMKTNTSRRVTKEVEPYVQLQRQMHEALLREHPEWVQPNGECPMCEAYESRLAELLGLSSQDEHRSAA